MLPIRFQIDIKSVEAEIGKLTDALDHETPKALAEICDDVAEEAIQGHSFANRTGNLEASIHADSVEGSFSLGTLRGGVIADEDYAEYVDEKEGYAYLQPAFDRVEPHAAQIIELHLQEAAAKAGW